MSVTCRERTCPLPGVTSTRWGAECEYHAHVFADDWHEPTECGHCGGRGERRSLPHGETDWSCRPCSGSGYADLAAGERYHQLWERRRRAYGRAVARHRRTTSS